MHWKRFLCFSVLLLVLIPALQAQEEDIAIARWTPAEYLGIGWFPSMTIDATGTAHLAWYGTNPSVGADLDDDLLMYSQRRIDTDWTAPIDMIYAGAGGYTVRNALAVSNDGVLYAMYRAGTQHHIIQAAADKAMNVDNWGGIINFYNGAYYLDMMVDSHNIVHAVSSEQTVNLSLFDTGDLAPEAIAERFPCAYCSDLIYRRSMDKGKTWTKAVNLSNTIEGSERQDIFQGKATGRLYLSWSEGSDWYVSQGDYADGRFRYSEDHGETWSEPVIIAGSRSQAPTQFAMTEMPDGSLFVVWRDGANSSDRSIYYQISHDIGATWTDPEPVPGIQADSISESILDHYNLATDLVGALHLVAVGYDPVTAQGPALYHIEYRQGRWLTPNRIFYNPRIRRPEWPVIEVGPRNELHVAWFIRVGDSRNAADVGSLHIYTAYRLPTLLNREFPVAYVPTPTPEPTIFAPMFDTTPTPIATFAPLDPDLDPTISQDMYAIRTMLGALAAVLVLSVVILLLSGYRPRFFTFRR